MEMLPGMSNLMQNVKGDVGQTKIKAYMTIMDSMTDEGTCTNTLLYDIYA